MSGWKEKVEEEWRRIHGASPAGPLFPLMSQGFGSGEIIAAVESLLTGQITMGANVREFEKQFAAAVGAPYAVMVNSGSSANLLALAVLTNAARSVRLEPADEVLVPAVCWSTSIWPIVQMGLRPVLVDVDADTLNVSIADLRRRITSRTRALVAVHVLGNSAPMLELLAVARDHNLLIVEDTCESLGAMASARALGTFGTFGTFSFYYSHHITTGEGGMIVCHTTEDADLVRCLRAHGWTRELSDRAEIEARYPSVDPRFNFVNVGYNLRPLEIQAAFGILQLARLPEMNRVRNENRTRLIQALESHTEWRGQYTFPRAASGTEPAWFGFTLLRNDGSDLPSLLRRIETRGVENRPIISGNFARQQGLRLFGIAVDPLDYPGAEIVHERGFFIGLQTRPLEESMLATLADILLTS